MATTTKKQNEALEAKFEQRLEDAINEVAATEFTPEKAKQRRTKANASDLDFCKIYFPKIFDSGFNRMHKVVAGWERGNYTLEASRWFGKSAFTYVAKGIKHIAMGKGGIFLLALEKETTAISKTKALKRLITKNKLLCYDYGIKVLQDEGGNYIFQADNGQTNLIAASVRQGLRSLSDDEFNRIRIAIMDDLYSRKNVKSESHRDDVYDFVTSEVWGMMEPDGISILLGNSITEDSPVIKIRTEFTQHTGKYYVLPAMNEDETQSNWPQRYSFEYIQTEWMPPNKPYDVWMGDYMCAPVEVGEILDPDWIRYGPSLNLIKIIVSITALDPSHGDSPAACDKGACTMGWGEDGKSYVIEQYLRKEAYALVFDYLDEVHRYAPNHRVILFENDFNQWAFAEPYYNSWRQDKKALPLILINSKDSATDLYGADKTGRMMNLVHPHQTGKIVYVQELKDNPDHKSFRNKNYIRFGKHGKTKLDGLDSEATAYIHLPSYIETGNFKSLKQRNFQKETIKEWFR